jgi:hypothetical protein
MPGWLAYDSTEQIASETGIKVSTLRNCRQKVKTLPCPATYLGDPSNIEINTGPLSLKNKKSLSSV